MRSYYKNGDAVVSPDNGTPPPPYRQQESQKILFDNDISRSYFRGFPREAPQTHYDRSNRICDILKEGLGMISCSIRQELFSRPYFLFIGGGFVYKDGEELLGFDLGEEYHFPLAKYGIDGDRITAVLSNGDARQDWSHKGNFINAVANRALYLGSYIDVITIDKDSFDNELNSFDINEDAKARLNVSEVGDSNFLVHTTFSNKDGRWRISHPLFSWIIEVGRPSKRGCDREKNILYMDTESLTLSHINSKGKLITTPIPEGFFFSIDKEDASWDEIWQKHCKSFFASFSPSFKYNTQRDAEVALHDFYRFRNSSCPDGINNPGKTFKKLRNTQDPGIHLLTLNLCRILKRTAKGKLKKIVNAEISSLSKLSNPEICFLPLYGSYYPGNTPLFLFRTVDGQINSFELFRRRQALLRFDRLEEENKIIWLKESEEGRSLFEDLALSTYYNNNRIPFIVPIKEFIHGFAAKFHLTPVKASGTIRWAGVRATLPQRFSRIAFRPLVPVLTLALLSAGFTAILFILNRQPLTSQNTSVTLVEDSTDDNVPVINSDKTLPEKSDNSLNASLPSNERTIAITPLPEKPVNSSKSDSLPENTPIADVKTESPAINEGTFSEKNSSETVDTSKLESMVSKNAIEESPVPTEALPEAIDDLVEENLSTEVLAMDAPPVESPPSQDPLANAPETMVNSVSESLPESDHEKNASDVEEIDDIPTEPSPIVSPPLQPLKDRTYTTVAGDISLKVTLKGEELENLLQRLVEENSIEIKENASGAEIALLRPGKRTLTVLETFPFEVADETSLGAAIEISFQMVLNKCVQVIRDAVEDTAKIPSAVQTLQTYLQIPFCKDFTTQLSLQIAHLESLQ